MPKKEDKKDIIRSSAAEYLTFVAATGGKDDERFEIRYEDENIWLTQRMMSELYGVNVRTINDHIKKIFDDKELDKVSTIRKIRIVQNEGARQINREIIHYNLQMIIAVGFKVNNEQAVQFRKWANKIVKEYTIKGYAMDDERIKSGGSILTKKYFEEQLQRIREIRLSERMLYQKIADIYATSIDYDVSAKTTKRFFATIANKMHYAVHGRTAAEVIVDRADSEKKNMGLTTWDAAPNGKIQRYDVIVAKNYLTKEELEQMGRLVSGYLDFAEDQARRNIPMTMSDWEEQLNGLLKLLRRDVLQDAGKVTAELAKKHALTEFEKYRVVQDRLYESDFDRFLAEENDAALQKLEKEAKEKLKKLD